MLHYARTGDAPESPADAGLFRELVVSAPRRPARLLQLSVSFVLHAVAIAAAVLLPLFLVEVPPEIRGDSFRIFYYDPPPPPPPPLPRGPGLVARAVPQPKAPEPARETPALTVVVPSAAATVVAPEQPIAPDAAGGDPHGSDMGVADGMEGGVEGGMVGGVPGGVLGGVIGGTGTGPIPVMAPDRPPRILRGGKPQYPQEAFVKKVQGTVMLEILIDDRGHVVRARVLQSVPLLDEAALAAVRAWLFLPAIHHGQPVATIARAPVSFTIY